MCLAKFEIVKKIINLFFTTPFQPCAKLYLRTINKSSNAVEYTFLLFVSFSILSSIRMSKRQKLRFAVYHELKATREHDERKCAASLHVFRQKIYVAKAKWKDKNAECTS